MARQDPRSITDVCEVETFRGDGAGPETRPSLLIEVPHGATRRRDYETIRQRLAGALPGDLEAFFFVNTDVGAPECARAIARLVVGIDPLPGDPAPRGTAVRIVRGLLPRTLVDLNRRLAADLPAADRRAFTPAIPQYVRDPADVRLLETLHRRYHEQAAAAYEEACGAGGLALTLHTYAPRSVRIDTIDEGIVAALRRAYEAEVWESWELRPDVEMIGEATDGTTLAPAAVVEALRDAYAAAGIELRENVTYRLHPETMGHHYSLQHPGRVLCLEINRARLADPFTPFREMRIGRAKVAEMAAPIAAALRAALSR